MVVPPLRPSRQGSVVCANRNPEVWLVDLKEKMLFVFCDLAEGEYRTAKTLRRGGSVACTAFPNDPMPVDQIIL